MISWLNTNSGAVIALLTFVLVVVTYLYVRYTKGMLGQMQKQCGEMENQRMDACIPVLYVDWIRQRYVDSPQGFNVVGDALRQVVVEVDRLMLVNQGPGTALHVRASVQFMHYVLTDGGALQNLGEHHWDYSVGALSPGGQHDTRLPLSFTGPDPVKVHMEYEDIHGRKFRSDVILQKDAANQFTFASPEKVH